MLNEKLKLGILYKNGEPVNHRSLFKVMLNPIFRRFGFCFGTNLDDSGKFGWYSKIKTRKTSKIQYDFHSYNEHDFVLKVRTII